jgi:hypothetical protein
VIAFASIVTLVGVILVAVSLPLIYRKVPMNHLYGIRIPRAFESEQRWYDINAYGGRLLARWSLLIILVGVVGFFLPPTAIGWYPIGVVATILICALIPLIQIVRWSSRLPN